MTSEEIRQSFLDFFKSKSHAVVPSSSLIPDDPSVLLTTAGMQQFKKYYTGELDAMKDFGSKSTASVQKSFRTADIDEVGDERHLTFFEMLGNFSFGGYFKKEAIAYAHEFITKKMGLKISYVTIFKGKDEIGVPRDEESRAIWKSLDPSLDVREEGMDDVFWGPTGTSGPCGPTTEVYCKNGAGQDIEVWNVVFNQYFFQGSREELNSGGSGKKLELLKTPGVDTGMGFERLVMIAQKTPTVFETDLFADFITSLDKYPELTLAHKRIIIDHLRGAMFLIADGVRPSNKEAGYVLRRLLRRAMVYGKNVDLQKLLKALTEKYKPVYQELKSEIIFAEFEKEFSTFSKTLTNGLRELEKVTDFTPQSAFKFFESFGLPYEIIKDRAPHLKREEFDKEFAKHQEISRAGSEKKFGGHGLILDTGELKAGNEEELKKVLRLHTATHLLQQALRMVLGTSVSQRGSDITPERTRFDFNFDRKLTPEEIKKVEDIVNDIVKKDLPMQYQEMPQEEAKKTGALHFFKAKYPDQVKVYFVGKTIEEAFSKEFCGGPHVDHTGLIGNFKIAKEEAVSAGVRRIRGIVE